MSINNIDSLCLSKNYNILYIGHNTNTIKKLALHFNRIYFENTKEKYISTYKEKNIDFVVADFSGLKSKGLELNKELKNIDKTKPFILLLENTDLIYYTKSLDLEIDGYLMSNLCEKQINAIIKNLKNKGE